MTLDTQLAPETRHETGEWNEPHGIGARGTLIVLVGRGENGSVYQRFGSRLGSDAYRVRTVVDAVRYPDAAKAQVAALIADETLPSPKVLVGSDSGAALALELAAAGVGVDAVVVAGLPTRAEGEGRPNDIEARTACPNHQGVLNRAGADGALWNPLPADLLGVVSSAVPVPVLAIHGEDDTVSALDDALAIYRELPRHDIAVVAGGRHDILNDVTHRSVAATIVLFLERLRLDAELTPIVTTA